MQRWAADAASMPDGVYVDLLRLTQERAAVLDSLAAKLRQAP